MTVDRYTRIDILVNNAGFAIRLPPFPNLRKRSGTN